MKDIRIAYVDFWRDFQPEDFLFTRILKKRYNIIIDYEKPEYIFCSFAGNNYLNYNCPRILYLGEAKAPDFNVYDYAIAFDDIVFGDRYLRYPFFFLNDKNWKMALRKHEKEDHEYLCREKFCNSVVSNSLGCNVRDQFFDKLCEYKMVDSGGRHKNNLPDHKPIADKLAFQQQYKFSFAFENSSFPGYVTEKIIDAWAAGTVPLYWGAPDVADYFNKKAFIDCTKMKSVDEIIAAVKEIDENDEKYLNMMKEPILHKDSAVYEMMKEEYLSSFLYHIFDQEPEAALRRNSAFTMWGYNYEHHMAQWKKLEDKKWFQFARKVIKRR